MELTLMKKLLGHDFENYMQFMIADTLWQFRPDYKIDGSPENQNVYEEVGAYNGPNKNTRVLLKAISYQLDEVLKVLNDLTEKTYFRVLKSGEGEYEQNDGAHNVQLDGIGEIVGLSRKQATNLSGYLEKVDEIQDNSLIPSDIGEWIQRSGFPMYYPDAVMDDVPYSDLVNFKIFLNNSNGTYSDLMTAVRQFWDTDKYPVGYEEQYDHDARIILKTELHQNDDGTYPNVRLYMLAPLVKAAGVELYRQAITTSNEMPFRTYLGGAFFPVVMETRLPYILFDHNFQKNVSGNTRLENIAVNIMEETDGERFLFERVSRGLPTSWYRVVLRYSSIQDFDTLVFPTIHNGEIVKEIHPPSRTYDESHSSAPVVHYKHVHIPNTISIIGADMFDNFVDLETCYIPKSVQSIGTYAFRKCTNLRSVTIDFDSPISGIPGYMFDKCYNLEYVTIPKSVQIIADKAFRYCDNLKTVVFGGTRSEWNDIMFQSTGNSALREAEKIYLGG